ncbi:MAG: patatin-like phospholipase family protein [Gammaproteobacteria bacterium]|nr:patatin-like phospholipase family protein [Gammaproteobacteria bacterium]MBU1441972.1 patatin-like phospholipase family protein [Gammaproteobacteria bacterium]MBU2285777.1 patatin-like phospholipase family protein [Gammaproteobacteria bacterium]MBU2409796.1 patatin-like phospholipase family protein [Gammaproteobacteria bacterium]
MPRVSTRRILALDGGGIRCLIGIEILLALEERLAAETGDPGRRLCQHFDLVAGTSGGAIVGTAVALGLPMREIRDFVVANARNMFLEAPWHTRLRSWYDKSVLERNMRDWFGDDTTLGSDKLRTLLMLVMRNWSTDSPWLVSNNPAARFNARELDDCNLDLKLWQLARASAAAPAYYTPETIRFGVEKPYDFVFVDGGLTAFLNPAFKAFQFATTAAYGLQWPAGEERMLLVSVGAGEARHRRVGQHGDSVNLWTAMAGMPNAMLQATVREQDLLCRTFGRCRTGHEIDLEVGDMQSTATAIEPRLFGYHRLSPQLTTAGLAALGLEHIATKSVIQIDAVEQVEALSEIGRRYAAQVIDGVWRDCVDAAPAARQA